jgi:hypothetical protein
MIQLGNICGVINHPTSCLCVLYPRFSTIAETTAQISTNMGEMSGWPERCSLVDEFSQPIKEPHKYQPPSAIKPGRTTVAHVANHSAGG